MRIKLLGCSLSILCIILLLFPLIASAEYQRPDIKNGLAGKWHKGRMCVTCHDMLLGLEGSSKIVCHDCHSRIKNGVISGEIAALHENKVCVRCHVGTKKTVYNVTAQDFHRVMPEVACTECHVVRRGGYLRPNKTLCSDCHPGGPHVVHGDRLSDMCRRCHGEFGEQFVGVSVNDSVLSGYVFRGVSSADSSLQDGLVYGLNVTKPQPSGFVTLGEMIAGILVKIVSVFGG
jgi:hypothetical protein